MSNIIASANNKVKNNAGESISETLVSVLISALALVMLAGAITTATRIVKNSRTKLEAYYKANEIMAEMPTSSSDSSVEVLSTGKTIRFIESGNDAASETENYNIVMYNNKVFSDKIVTEYKVK